MNLKNCLKVFSDVLGVELRMENGEPVHNGLGLVKTPLGLSMLLKIDYLASFQSQQVGVVFRVLGDLGIMISYFPKTESVSVYLLNLAKITERGAAVSIKRVIKSSGSLRDNIEVIREAIVASYYLKDGIYAKLTLPS